MSLISSGYHVRIHYVAEWGQVPFWACRLPIQALSRSAGCRSRRLRTFVENPVRSPEPVEGIATRSGRRRFRLAAYPLLTLALRRLVATLPP